MYVWSPSIPLKRRRKSIIKCFQFYIRMRSIINQLYYNESRRHTYLIIAARMAHDLQKNDAESETQTSQTKHKIIFMWICRCEKYFIWMRRRRRRRWWPFIIAMVSINCLRRDCVVLVRECTAANVPKIIHIIIIIIIMNVNSMSRIQIHKRHYLGNAATLEAYSDMDMVCVLCSLSPIRWLS